MKLGVLFSGGKDSYYSLYLASKHYEIACLISIISKNKESYMFHVPNIDLVDKQAEALGIPLIKVETEGKKEVELKDLNLAIKKAIKKYSITGIVTGALASTYQATRVQKICNELNLWCFNPLWQMDQVTLLKDLIKNNFKVIISGVFAYPFTKDWLGKEIDLEVINKLVSLSKKYQINPAGEGGEIETFVIDSPLNKFRIKIKDFSKHYENYSGMFNINSLELKEK